MSFSSQLKDELCSIRPSGCCKAAQCYGMLMFSRSFSFENISILTENEQVAGCYSKLLRLTFDVTAAVTRSGADREFLSVSVTGGADRTKIMHSFGYTKQDRELRITESFVRKDCCAGAFVRGAFLVSGSITDPNKGYHLEFSVSENTSAGELTRLLVSCGFAPRTTRRNGSSVIYFKGSDQIEDLLTFMGAGSGALEIMNIKIYKDFRNLANRRANCEVANIEKTVSAAAPQLKAIEFLKSSGIIEELTPELKEAARLREENPELSLRDLAEMTADKVSRSGFNHRLAKLVKIADDEERLRQYRTKP